MAAACKVRIQQTKSGQVRRPFLVCRDCDIVIAGKMKKIALSIVILSLVLGFSFGKQISTFVLDKLPGKNFLEEKISEFYDQKIRKPALDVINKKIDSLIGEAAQNLATEAKSVAEKIIAPPPLIKNQESKNSSVLTKSGVFTWTNVERIRVAELPTLKPNYLLDQVAEARLNDMFKNQYFEHNSPAGESASTEAKRVNYEYVLIGENIALGNFEGDKKLVEAWMMSPGHRANILNLKYTELGVAVGQDIFAGRKQWIGVQIFSKPKSDCAAIDGNLESAINMNRSKIEALEAQAEAIKTELESSHPKTREEVSLYNEKVSSYNSLVAQINPLIEETKTMIKNYNSQVSKFNLCVES